jgi:hypothetical protein
MLIVGIGSLLPITMRLHLDARRHGTQEEFRAFYAETLIALRALLWGIVFFVLLVLFEQVTATVLPRWLAMLLGFIAIIGGWFVHRPGRA